MLKKLLKSFPVGGTPRNNQVQVFVNNAASNDFAYNANTKAVVFNNAPLDGINIRFEFENNDGPVLKYTLPIGMVNNPRDFKLFYNNAEIQFQRDGMDFTIGAGDHAEDRELTLRYEIDDAEVKMFQLPQVPLEDSFELISSNMDCSLGNGFEVVDGVLVSNCIVKELTEFELRYQYIDLRRNFEAAVATPEQGKWKVYVDGALTQDFVRNGTEFVVKCADPHWSQGRKSTMNSLTKHLV